MSYRFNKSTPTEIINIGDLIMLDIKTGLVTIATGISKEDYPINSSNIIGICSKSDNKTHLPLMLDCGTSTTEIDKEDILHYLDLGDSTTETDHVIQSPNSEPNPREYIEVQSQGIVTLNTDHRHIEVGDKVVLSVEPNKVTSNMFDDFDRREWIYARPIGKVVNILPNNKVEVLLDIE